MNKKDNTLLHYFDLEEYPEMLQDEFIEIVTDTIMRAIMQKAWVELEGDKKERFTELFEASYDDPENEKKSKAVLDFLDENIVHLKEFVQKELQALEDTYKTNRDELEDALS